MKILINYEIEFNENQLIGDHSPAIVSNLTKAIEAELFGLPGLKITGGVVAVNVEVEDEKTG